MDDLLFLSAPVFSTYFKAVLTIPPKEGAVAAPNPPSVLAAIMCIPAAAEAAAYWCEAAAAEGEALLWSEGMPAAPTGPGGFGMP